MSLEDFCRCTPSEFRHVFDAWTREKEAQTHQTWEQVRLMSAMVLQPWCKKRLKPTDVFALPWDPGEKERAEQENISEEERKQRFQAALKRYGLDS